MNKYKRSFPFGSNQAKLQRSIDRSIDNKKGTALNVVFPGGGQVKLI